MAIWEPVYIYGCSSVGNARLPAFQPVATSAKTHSIERHRGRFLQNRRDGVGSGCRAEPTLAAALPRKDVN